MKHLPTAQRTQLIEVIRELECLFPDSHSVTHLTEHVVDVGDKKPKKQHPYRRFKKKRDIWKAMLCSSPVLAAPQFDRPFKLAVDASAQGCGAVLFQQGDDDYDHPVSFYSKKFNRHQLNYSTVEKEALGLIQALKYYEVYLKSSTQPILVYTDHNPLVFINRVKSSNQRVLRWSLLLQDFDLSIKHLPGAQNVIADALSRAPIDN